jgi:hypothetical protein
MKSEKVKIARKIRFMLDLAPLELIVPDLIA